MRKTLSISIPSDTSEAPSVKKKGRGWEISEKRLDALHERAREMRRHPTPAQEALAKLPANLKAYRPVLRTMQGIRTEIAQHQSS